MTEHDVAPDATAGDGLREAIVETLRLYGIRGENLGDLRPQSVTAAILALPELAELRAKAAEPSPS